MPETDAFPPGAEKAAFYDSLIQELTSVLGDERDRVANAANTAALLYQRLGAVNWVGFYFHVQGELVVGPFQGKPACVRIAFGKGVCGTAAAEQRTVVVPDVHEFPGHIACDADSRSEIVVPLLEGKTLLGVLDIDSPQLNRFDTTDAAGLEKVAQRFLQHSD